MVKWLDLQKTPEALAVGADNHDWCRRYGWTYAGLTVDLAEMPHFHLAAVDGEYLGGGVVIEGDLLLPYLEALTLADVLHVQKCRDPVLLLLDLLRVLDF